MRVLVAHLIGVWIFSIAALPTADEREEMGASS